MPKSGRAAALVRAGALMGVGALVLAVVGCTPEEPGGGSSPGPASPTPAASPTESAEDRAERERGEHAIEVYLEATKELDHLLQQGESKPSAKLEEFAGGAFLEAIAELLHQVSQAGERLEGDIEQVGIWVDGTTTPQKVRLTSCEDGTDSYFVDRDGKRLEGEEGAQVQIQKVTVEATQKDTWKVTGVETESYSTFEGTECSDAA